VVIFVIRLAKPLSENTQRFHSAKVKVMHWLMQWRWLTVIATETAAGASSIEVDTSVTLKAHLVLNPDTVM